MADAKFYGAPDENPNEGMPMTTEANARAERSNVTFYVREHRDSYRVSCAAGDLVGQEYETLAQAESMCEWLNVGTSDDEAVSDEHFDSPQREVRRVRLNLRPASDDELCPLCNVPMSKHDAVWDDPYGEKHSERDDVIEEAEAAKREAEAWLSSHGSADREEWEEWALSARPIIQRLLAALQAERTRRVAATWKLLPTENTKGFTWREWARGVDQSRMEAEQEAFRLRSRLEEVEGERDRHQEALESVLRIGDARADDLSREASMMKAARRALAGRESPTEGGDE